MREYEISAVIAEQGLVDAGFDWQITSKDDTNNTVTMAVCSDRSLARRVQRALDVLDKLEQLPFVGICVLKTGTALYGEVEVDGGLDEVTRNIRAANWLKGEAEPGDLAFKGKITVDDRPRIVIEPYTDDDLKTTG